MSSPQPPAGPESPDARAKMGISDGMLRLSIGLEDIDDLIDDVTVAAKAARG